MKTKEEILKENNIFPGFRSTYTFDGILASMEEYALQFPSPEIPEISDDEIEKTFPTDLKVLCKQTDTPLNFDAEQGEYLDEIKHNHQLRQFGAKWYRTKLREGGKKDG